MYFCRVMKKICTIAASMLVCLAVSAQSRNFNLGKWTEIHASILKELNRSYVDTLPLDRMEKEGINAMLSVLDPYTIYVPAEDNKDFEMMISNTYGGIGAVIFKPDVQGNVIINEPYEGSPAQRNGIVCGDQIISIDGVPAKGLTSSDASSKMRGEPGTKVVLKMLKLRTGDTVDVAVTREKIHLPDVTYSGMLNDKTGYIAVTGFSEGMAGQVRKEVVRLKKECGMSSLILDLRNNGGGLLNEAVDLVSIFVPEGSLVVSAKGRAEGSDYTCLTKYKPVDTKMPLTVMINSASASSSEIVAGSLQDMDRATIVGSRSFGKGLVQSIRPLPYGGQLKVTTAKYYTPSGRCVQAIDYATRREDGSVSHIPDSLTHTFKTASGRTVRDGGGITPDIEIKPKEYSRISFSLVRSGVVEEFVLDYVCRHESIAEVDEFVLGDEEFDRFVEFAAGKEFDFRSSARTYFDWMKDEIGKDGLSESLASELEALDKALTMEKTQMIRLKKDEIVPLIEQEIVVRYYFQKAGEKLRIRYDEELKKALELI